MDASSPVREDSRESDTQNGKLHRKLGITKMRSLYGKDESQTE